MKQEPPRRLQFSPEFLHDLRKRWDQRPRPASPTGPDPLPPICDEVYEEALRTMALEDGLPKADWDRENLPEPIPLILLPEPREKA